LSVHSVGEMVKRKIKIHSFVRISLENQQILAGRLIACDDVMNALVEEAMEFKWNHRAQKWQKRHLGFCMIRGSSVSSVSIEDEFW